MFITILIRVSHWSLSWVRSIQSISPQTISLRFIVILSFQLCLLLPSYHSPSGFLKNTIFHPLSPRCLLHSQPISSHFSHNSNHTRICRARHYFNTLITSVRLDILHSVRKYILFSLNSICMYISCRLCGLLVRVLGYRNRGPGSILGTTRFSEK
jgi:hypothetical protein